MCSKVRVKSKDEGGGGDKEEAGVAQESDNGVRQTDGRDVDSRRALVYSTEWDLKGKLQHCFDLGFPT